METREFEGNRLAGGIYKPMARNGEQFLPGLPPSGNSPFP